MRRAGTADQLRKSCVCVWCDCELCETCDVCRLCDLCCHQRGSTTLCTISAVSAVSDCDGHKNVFTLSSHVQYTYIRCEPVHATPHQSAEPTGAASRTNRLVRKGRDRRRRARPGKSNRGGRRGGAAQQQQPPRACERLPPSQQQRDRSMCSQRGKKLERRHHGHWLGLCGGQPPSVRYWRLCATVIVHLGASTPCHRAVWQSCKLVASAMSRRHNEVAARNEIAVDVGASTPHVIGAGGRPHNAGVREREPRQRVQDLQMHSSISRNLV